MTSEQRTKLSAELDALIVEIKAGQRLLRDQGDKDAPLPEAFVEGLEDSCALHRALLDEAQKPEPKAEEAVSS